MIPSWKVFDVLAVPSIGLVPPGWEAVDAMRSDAKAYAGSAHEAYLSALLRSDSLLSAVGGDPAFRDWTSFRPLRLSREEDWSDWLGHLIEKSVSGFLARELVGDAAARADRVEREVTTTEGYRADLVVMWSDQRTSHVEVKIGDMSFKKTFGTASALRKRYADDRVWTDRILLPEAHVAEWMREADRASLTDPHVDVLTWFEVAVALRRVLHTDRETIDWRVFAAAFAGTVEQSLLGLPARSRDSGREPTFRELLLATEHHRLIQQAGASSD